MTQERIREAAKMFSIMGRNDLAEELKMLAEAYQWQPIAELHEDYGDCVLINLDDPGYMQVGSNVNIDYNASEWTHFSRIVPLLTETFEKLKREMLVASKEDYS